MPPVDFQVGGANRARQFVTPTAVPSGLEELGRGIAAVGDVFRERAAQADLHNDNLTRLEREGAWQRRVTEGMAGLDPTSPTYLEDAETLHREATAETMADPDIKTRAVLETLETNLTRQTQAGLVNAVGVKTKAVEDRGLAMAGERLDAISAQIREDPDGADAYTANMAADLHTALAGVRPHIRDQVLREAGDSAISAQVEGLALAQRYDEAKNLLKDAEKELQPEAVRFLGRRIREIQNTHQNDFKAETDRDVANLEIQIDAAASTSDLRVAQERLDEFDAVGMFEGREQTRVRLHRKLQSAQQQIVTANKDLTLALQQYGSGSGNDSQKFADLAHGAISARYPEDLTSAERDVLDREFIKRSGWVPTSIKREHENAERTENAEMLARAAQREQSILEVAPGVDTGGGDRADMVRGFNDIGLPWDEAARLAMDRAPDKATAEARIAEFEEEFKGQDWREFLQDEGISPARGLFAPFTATADIPEALVQETERVVRNFYKLSGDFDAAKAAAAKHLSRTYGATNVGGVPVLQKFPPERYMPVGDARDEELRTAAIDGLVRGAIKAVGAEVPAVEDGQPYRLVSDRQTQRDLETGLRPSYEIQVRSKLPGDTMVPVWVETAAGVRTKLRLTMPDAATANQLPEVQVRRSEAERKAMEKDALGSVARTVGFGAAQALEAIAPDERSLRERHPFSGFLTRRNRER